MTAQKLEEPGLVVPGLERQRAMHVYVLLTFFSFYILEFCFYLHACVCVFVSVCYICAGTNRSQKNVSNPLEIELQAVVSCSTRVLESHSGPLEE